MNKLQACSVVAVVWWAILLIPCVELNAEGSSVFIDVWIAVTSLSVFFGLIAACYLLVKSAD